MDATFDLNGFENGDVDMLYVFQKSKNSIIGYYRTVDFDISNSESDFRAATKDECLSFQASNKEVTRLELLHTRKTQVLEYISKTISTSSNIVLIDNIKSIPASNLVSLDSFMKLCIEKLDTISTQDGLDLFLTQEVNSKLLVSSINTPI